jgi:TPR repeat protein
MDTTTPHEHAYDLLSEGKYDELIAFITPHVKAKDSWAEAMLGQCYRTGSGVNQDLEVARHYFELAAKQNDPYGKLLFGHHLLFEGNIEDGRKQLESAFEGGMSTAAGYIAQSYFNESDVPGSPAFDAGFFWLEKAATLGDPEAMHHMGWIIGNRGDTESQSEALRWFEKAAELGNGDSALNAGLAYAHGRGTEVNFDKARQYYEVAAESGMPNALHNLGALYYNGHLGEKDIENAFNYYNAAAHRGSFLSSKCISEMFEQGEIRDIGESPILAFAWILIAEEQATSLGHIEPAIRSRIKKFEQTLSDDEKLMTASAIEHIGKSLKHWVAPILVRLYEQDTRIESNAEKATFWRQQVEGTQEAGTTPTPPGLTTDTDLASLPKNTDKFVEWLPQLGLSEQQIHGLFVLVGLYAGTPRTADEIEEIYTPLQQVIPHDQRAVINQLVDDFFEEYQLPLEEFCLRSGYEFEFRPIKIREDIEPFHLLNLRDHKLLDPEINGVSKLADASRLFQSFLTALGESTFRQNRSMKEAFLAGVYQMQHMGQIDLYAVQQLSQFISTSAPLVIGHAFRAITRNTLDYSLNGEIEQAALHTLMSSMERDYAQQMWGFQSCLFFHDQQRISGVAELEPKDWHRWVTDRALVFSDAYPTQLVGFNQSGATLVGVPAWAAEVNDFKACDDFISLVWGFSADTLKNEMELLEYKALMIHTVYASLAISRDTLQ